MDKKKRSVWGQASPTVTIISQFVNQTNNFTTQQSKLAAKNNSL